MSVDIKITAEHRRNIRQILRGEEGDVTADLEARARRIAAAAGPGHRIDTTVGPNRVRVAVITDSLDAMRNEATNRSLTRAIDAGR